MSQKQHRQKDLERINKMYSMIEHAKNEDIAREACAIAVKWIGKAEKQAQALSELQKVRPAKGRWVRLNDYYVECSICGAASNYESPYCSECGAKLC